MPALVFPAGRLTKVTGIVKGSFSNALVDSSDDRAHELAQFSYSVLSILLYCHRGVGQTGTKSAVKIVRKLVLGDGFAMQIVGSTTMLVLG
jgi:hypothetical protein